MSFVRGTAQPATEERRKRLQRFQQPELVSFSTACLLSSIVHTTTMSVAPDSVLTKKGFESTLKADSDRRFCSSELNLVASRLAEHELCAVPFRHARNRPPHSSNSKDELRTSPKILTSSSRQAGHRLAFFLIFHSVRRLQFGFSLAGESEKMMLKTAVKRLNFCSTTS
jgi:hypothetical protein